MATRQKLGMCPTQNKKCYPSRGAAIRAALNYSKKRGTPLRYFWHGECKSYHLTKRTRW